MLYHNGTLLSSCFVPLISEKQISTGCYQQSWRQIAVAAVYKKYFFPIVILYPRDIQKTSLENTHGC